MMLVFPDPAPARTSVASSIDDKPTGAVSGVSGLLSIVSKKSFPAVQFSVDEGRRMPLARAVRGSLANFRTGAIRALASGPMASAFSLDSSEGRGSRERASSSRKAI